MLVATAPSVLFALAALAQDPPPAPPAPAATPAPSPAPPPPPPRIEWQRTLADALAVQQATGLPLLVAVNMDGEVFNERFANSTYHDPAFVASTRGYVCVVASPDRHTPRDHDALGNRIECPRFPGCTCGEHIAIEPELFAKYFDGTRNAPRHVGVSKDGKVLFDRFLDTSMQTAIDAIGKHAGDARKQPAASRDVAELARRRDALARRTMEAMWRDGDAAARAALLTAAATAANEPRDLLRAALRSDDAALVALAAKALAARATKDDLADVEDALARVGDTDAGLAQALVARLAELGKGDERAARLAAHFAAAATPSSAAKVPVPWSNPWHEGAFDAADRAAVERELDRCEAALRANGKDDEARLQFAVAQLALAELLARDGAKDAGLWFDDAIASARKVRAPGLEPEAQAVVAAAAWGTGDTAAAGKAAARVLASRNNDRRPPPFLAARALDTVLQVTAATVFADAGAAGKRSLRAELERTLALVDLLAQRRALPERGALAAAGLLELAGLRARARALLASAAQAFPASVAVHERWRARLLADLGAQALRSAYTAWVPAAGDRAAAEWFAAFAALVAAEQHTRDERAADATAAYGDAIARFAASASGNADYADSANHYAVLALAGRAELRTAAGDHDGACTDLLRAHELRPDSLDSSDGLERKPRAIAARVARASERAGKPELAARLKPLLP
jgi:hypothetical protein